MTVALRLAGTAFNDAGAPLRSKAMKWYDGQQLLGEGDQNSIYDREPGHRTIRLVVRDRGRESSASVEIYIDPVAPFFVGLKVPQRAWITASMRCM